MDLTWPALGVITAAGATVVGWVWSAARDNRAEHESIRRDMQRTIDAECKEMRKTLVEEAKGLRDDMQDATAELQLEHNRLANAQQKFELHVATEYIRSETLVRFEEKLDKLTDKFDAWKDELRKELRDHDAGRRG